MTLSISSERGVRARSGTQNILSSYFTKSSAYEGQGLVI